MSLCSKDKCEHYSKTTKYPKTCYYEPQCWKGYCDVMLFLLKRIYKKPNIISFNRKYKLYESSEVANGYYQDESEWEECWIKCNK